MDQDRKPAPNHDSFTPGTLFRKIVIYHKSLAVEENYISLIREVPTKKTKGYIKKSHVPIKDFGSLLKGPAAQFRGYLATIKDKKLKKLTLPVMNPAGIGLPEIPDESAENLVVINSGQWNGVIFCTEVAAEPVSLKSFQKAKNGDIQGLATLENGEELSLLNLESVLKREGFLLMVE